MTDIQAKELLDKYWAAETSLAEEAILKEHFRQGSLKGDPEEILFDFFAQEKERKSVRPIEIQKQPAKVISLMRRSMIGVAAAVALFAAITLMMPQSSNHKVVDDPEQALEVTLTALGFLNGSIDRSGMAVKDGLSQFDKTKIFSFYRNKEI
jgi:hypothetical protein